MSELTPCNFCTLQRLRRKYRYVKVEVDKHGWLEVTAGHAEDDMKVVASLMALSRGCVC